MTQDYLRKKFLFYHNEEGITYSHMAHQIGISAGFLCDFMKKRKQLSATTYQKAIKYYITKEKKQKEGITQ